MNQLIGAGRIVSGPGYIPVVTDSNNTTLQAGKRKIVVGIQQVYYATRPSPISTGAHVTASASQVLSWTNPLPVIPGNTVTSNVYFNVGTGTPTTQIASGITATSVTVSTLPETVYSWRVDSIDNGVTTVGPVVWTFDTKITPTVAVGTANSRQVAFQRVSPDPNSDATLIAVGTDDGYPLALTYTWEVAAMTDPNSTVTFVPSRFVQNPSVVLSKVTVPGTSSMTLPGATTATNWTDGNYHIRCEVFDGANAVGWTVLTLKAYANPGTGSTIYCDARKWVGFTALAGDINTDCKVDYRDLATLALQWLVCNSPDCM